MLKELQRLRALARSYPEAPLHPALAEALRRSGEAERAESILRERDVLKNFPAARVSLARALEEQGRSEEAGLCWETLAELVSDHPLLPAAAIEDSAEQVDANLFADLGEAELEQAFAAAEPQTDQMIDAHQVATQAVVELEAEEESWPISSESVVATATFAKLLEAQGHAQEASQVRSEIPIPTGGYLLSKTARVRRQLEQWLERLEARKG